MTDRNRLLYPAFDETFRRTWFRKALSVESDNLIGLWMHNEPSGVSIDRSGNGHNGVYTGVTLGEDGVPKIGYTSGKYDGSTSFNNIYSTGLAAAFNGNAGTLLLWIKVNALGIWTDGKNHYFTSLGGTDERLFIAKLTTNNVIRWYRRAGGVTDLITAGGYTDVDWMPLAVTWDTVADELIAYKDGVQAGATQATLGTWGTTLTATGCVMGGINTTPTNPLNGWLGPVLLSTKAYTPAQIAYLS